MKLVKESVRTYLHQAHGLNEVPDDAPLLEGGLLDSIDAMELVAFVSDTFAIALSTEDMRVENFATIEAIAFFVTERQPARSDTETRRTA